LAATSVVPLPANGSRRSARSIHTPRKASTAWQRSTMRKENTQRPSHSISALSPSGRRPSARSILRLRHV
jgi:hypothetical protein